MEPLANGSASVTILERAKGWSRKSGYGGLGMESSVQRDQREREAEEEEEE